MNTEPPEGDDLQRMLVSMKQHVLERATPRPARRRGRSGIVVGVVALLALGTATGAVALTLSQQDRPEAAPAQTQQPEPAPSATTSSSAPITGRPTPRPTPTPGPTSFAAASIPTDCRSVVPPSEYARLFGAAEPKLVSGPGTEFGPGFPATDLYCLWGSNSGSSGLALTMGTQTTEQDAGARVAFFGDLEPTCSSELGGSVCRVSFVPEGGGTQTRTRYERGGTWIEVDQRNFPTNGLLPAIVGEVWGD